jgi:hypothetical protein
MKPIEVFNYNQKRVDTLLNLYLSQSRPKNRDILRSSVIFAMGSLDAYIHQIISENIVKFIKLNIRKARRNPNQLLKLGKIIDMFNKMFKPIDYLIIFDKERPYVQFRKKFDDELFLRTYESPGQIQKAFSLFAIDNFWDEFQRSGNSKHEIAILNKIPKKLDDLFRRRNQIAHEMDRNRSRKKKNKRQKISINICRDCMRTTKKVVDFIEANYLDKNNRSYLFN